jgi:hypothetical protein
MNMQPCAFCFLVHKKKFDSISFRTLDIIVQLHQKGSW